MFVVHMQAQTPVNITLSITLSVHDVLYFFIKNTKIDKLDIYKHEIKCNVN